MGSYRFRLKDGVTLRQANKVVRQAIADVLDYPYRPDGVFATERLDRTMTYRGTPLGSGKRPTRRYVFGIGQRNAAGVWVRDTFVAHVENTPQGAEIQLCFPANYSGWNRADSYTRLRVGCYDALCNAGIIDRRDMLPD